MITPNTPLMDIPEKENILLIFCDFIFHIMKGYRIDGNLILHFL